MLKDFRSPEDFGSLRSRSLKNFAMSDLAVPPSGLPSGFEELAAARRGWIENVLRAWCRQAPLKELRKAEQEWFDIAGRADANATLWTWAWERFPDIVHPDLPGVHETHEIRVVLTDGTELTGYPDARLSLRGMLVVVGTDESGDVVTSEPVSIDQVVSITQGTVGGFD